MLMIDAISDVICPWCCIGKRRLEKAMAGRLATVRWHLFQLNTDMPAEGVERKAYRIRKFCTFRDFMRPPLASGCGGLTRGSRAGHLGRGRT